MEMNLPETDFSLTDKDAPRYYVETGDDKLSLIRDFPLAVRLEGYVTYNQGNTEQSDFTTPVAFQASDRWNNHKGCIILCLLHFGKW